MISSAVVIPDQPPPLPSSQSPPSPSLKRRQSSVSSESNKRPRLDTGESTDQTSAQGSPPASASLSTGFHTSSSDLRRKSSSTTAASAVEEKKRGQRLFGALLGTLSQTNSKPAQRKRDEIERRQQERLKRDNAEIEEGKRKKREEIDKARRVEQKSWNEESVHLRHRNMRAMAGYLKTKSEPYLYYKPWEVREDEAEQIKKQIDEAEEVIRAELAEHAASKGRKTSVNESTHSPVIDAQRQNEEQNSEKIEDVKMVDDHPEEQKKTNGVDEAEVNIRGGVLATNESAELDPEQPKQVSSPREEEKAKDDDHGGEELVEGQEDDVIY